GQIGLVIDDYPGGVPRVVPDGNGAAQVLQRVDPGHRRRLERRLAGLLWDDAQPHHAVDPAAAQILVGRPQRPDGTALANGLDRDNLGRRPTATLTQLL